MPATRNLVGGVVGVCPRLKVTGINARRVVALVADDKAFRDRAVNQSPTNTVRGLKATAANADFSIAAAHLGAQPRPAAIRTVEQEVGEKAPFWRLCSC
jgi:hypothetical protein